MLRTIITALAVMVIGLALYIVAWPEKPDLSLRVSSAGADEQMLERGKYLLHAGGCISCHTRKDDAEGFLAGGRALETPFGTFYSPNITSDRETGIGAWSDSDFVLAMQQGLSPEGDHYFPAFPYPAYTGISQEDLIALKAYLFSLPPVQRVNREHELAWYVSFRPLLVFWKMLNFKAGEFEPDASQSAQWNRGAYLVRQLGHCGECHTPRDLTGGLKHTQYLAGNPDGPEGDKVPNITTDKNDGIGGWSISDIELFLEMGMLPDGDFAGSSMTAVIDDNTSHLSIQDRQAIGVYLKSLPALPTAEK